MPGEWAAGGGRQCDLVHVDGGHFDFVPWNDIVELGRSALAVACCRGRRAETGARASHESTVVVVDDAPSLGDVARAVKVLGILLEKGASAGELTARRWRRRMESCSRLVVGMQWDTTTTQRIAICVGFVPITSM
eukprot:754218-Hanusia_phi.AAC.2